MSIGCPEPSTMRTQARSDCGHCSNGPRVVVDQSNARIPAPTAPPPATTEKITCVLMRSMAESLDSASALSDDLLSLVRSRHVESPAAMLNDSYLGDKRARFDTPLESARFMVLLGNPIITAYPRPRNAAPCFWGNIGNQIVCL